MQRINARTFATAAKSKTVLIDGVRIPFQLSNTGYNNYITQDLARFALKGLLTKTAVDPKIIDYVCLGTVIQEGV